ncbi:ROK family protein [Smaragdicoccus niigatensis]|uniref:ROK family protein n=1 Tax=Smaragdicoccus niigatensis TaxID=359359 RepID=UPI0003694556|nr:ROK family protein [Smaragdicoccus niigatensis]
MASSWFVVGLDNGGTKDNGTVLDPDGNFLVDRMVESPSNVLDGPEAAVDALAQCLDNVLELTGVSFDDVRAVGLDTPGPASAEGVISSMGSTNFSTPEWRGFDIRTALEKRIGRPVVYNNDANAAALYAHREHFGSTGYENSSVSAIIGTGLGGGIVESGRIIKGRNGMAGELGHVFVPAHDILEEGQPIPRCNCGFESDAESIASLTGIQINLLPYWLTRYPDHPLHGVSGAKDRAKQVRTLAEEGDEMSLKIFEQQAKAIGRLFTIAANFTDPTAYFIGGGVVETKPDFRNWFIDTVRANTTLRTEQAKTAVVATVPDLDMAGARGAALGALAHVLQP